MKKRKLDKIMKLGDKVSVHVTTIFIALLSLSALSFLKRDFKTFVTELGFNFYLNPLFFLILSFILIFIIFIRISSNQTHVKKLKAVIFFKKLNMYFIVALYFCLILTYYGYYFLTVNYGTSLPIENFPMFSIGSQEAFKIAVNSFKEFPELSCRSKSGKKDFVLNDELECSISFSQVKNPSHPITNTYVGGKIPNDKDQIMYYRDHYGDGPINFILDLNNTEIYQIRFGIGLSNNTRFGDNIATHDLILNTEILMPEEARSKNDRRISLFITLLSIVTFAVFGTMNNIKNLLKKS